MNLHDMKRTAKEKREAKKEMRSFSPMDGDYHYGLRVHLGGEEMDKLGLKDNPKPGDVFHIQGHAKVVHSHKDEHEGGGKRHIEIHFHKMGMEQVPEDEGGKSLRDEIKDNTATADLKKEGAAKTKEKTADKDVKNAIGEAD